jgi:hypothetical protein
MLHFLNLTLVFLSSSSGHHCRVISDPACGGDRPNAAQVAYSKASSSSFTAEGRNEMDIPPT